MGTSLGAKWAHASIWEDKELADLLNQRFSDFQPISKANIAFLESHVGETLYLPHLWLVSGQTEYGPLKIKSELKGESGLKVLYPSSIAKVLFHEGYEAQKPKTNYSKSKAAIGVLTHLGVVIVDGNHKVLVNGGFGGTHMPVKILSDFTHLPNNNAILREALLKEKLIFPWYKDGTVSKTFLRFNELKQNIYRDLAGFLIAKVDTRKASLDEKVVSKNKQGFVLAAKIKNQAIAYYEFYLAMALARTRYSIPKNMENMSFFDVARAISHIQRFKKTNHPAMTGLSGIQIFDEPKNANDKKVFLDFIGKSKIIKATYCRKLL